MRLPLILALLPLSLAAQDRFHVGLDLAIQGGSSQAIDTESDAKLESRGRVQFGLTTGYRALSIGKVQIRATADVRFKANADVEATHLGPFTGKVGSLAHDSIALGAEASWCGRVELGGGLQLRREHMTLSSTQTGASFTTTTTRPWLTSHVGWAWKTTEGHHTFLRATLSISLDSGHSISSMKSSEDLTEALAPGAEIGVQAGLRF